MCYVLFLKQILIGDSWRSTTFHLFVPLRNVRVGITLQQSTKIYVKVPQLPSSTGNYL